MSEKLLAPREVEELIGIDAHTLAQWRCRGEGPPYFKLGDGRTAPIRYRLKDLHDWLNARRVGAVA